MTSFTMSGSEDKLLNTHTEVKYVFSFNVASSLKSSCPSELYLKGKILRNAFHWGATLSF